MTADTGDDGRPVPAPVDGVSAVARSWYPPLPLWKLFLLMVVTVGFYSPFYLYRTARELRDHGNPKITPWLYPFSMLIALASAIAAGKLAGAARRSAEPAVRWSGADPTLIGVLVFVGQTAIGIASLASLTSVFVGAVVVFSTPWLLMQHQLNRIKEGLADEAFRTRPNRYTALQWVALAAGGLVYVGFGFALWEDVVRLSGEELSADEPYVDPRGRFVLQAPRDGWTVVGPNYLAEGAELELLGPGIDDWAVLYVHEQSGWSIDDLVEFRFRELVDITNGYRELRRLFEGTEVAVSYAGYSGRLPFEGPSDYAVTSFVTPDRAVELIVFTAGDTRERTRGRELAESLRPLPAPGVAR